MHAAGYALGQALQKVAQVKLERFCSGEALINFIRIGGRKEKGIITVLTDTLTVRAYAERCVHPRGLRTVPPLSTSRGMTADWIV